MYAHVSWQVGSGRSQPRSCRLMEPCGKSKWTAWLMYLRKLDLLWRPLPDFHIYVKETCTMTIMFWMMLSLFFGLCRLNSWGMRRPSKFLLSQNAKKNDFCRKARTNSRTAFYCMCKRTMRVMHIYKCCMCVCFCIYRISDRKPFLTKSTVLPFQQNVNTFLCDWDIVCWWKKCAIKCSLNGY